MSISQFRSSNSRLVDSPAEVVGFIVRGKRALKIMDDDFETLNHRRYVAARTVAVVTVTRRSARSVNPICRSCAVLCPRKWNPCNF